MPRNPLTFSIQTQECSEWCWAAAVSSIASFVNSPQLPGQCEVVDKQCFDPVFAPSPGCCLANNRCVPKNAQCICNQTSSIGRALSAYNLLTGSAEGQIPSAGDFDTITRQIDQSCVVVIQVVDRSNPELVHVMVVFGFSGLDDLMIGDPMDGNSSHYSYSHLIAAPGGSPSGWQLLKFFTTVPGLS